MDASRCASTRCPPALMRSSTLPACAVRVAKTSTTAAVLERFRAMDMMERTATSATNNPTAACRLHARQPRGYPGKRDATLQAGEVKTSIPDPTPPVDPGRPRRCFCLSTLAGWIIRHRLSPNEPIGGSATPAEPTAINAEHGRTAAKPANPRFRFAAAPHRSSKAAQTRRGRSPPRNAGLASIQPLTLHSSNVNVGYKKQQTSSSPTNDPARDLHRPRSMGLASMRCGHRLRDVYRVRGREE